MPACTLCCTDNRAIIAANVAMAALVLSLIVATICFMVIVAICRIPIVVSAGFVTDDTAYDGATDDTGRTAVSKNRTPDSTGTHTDSSTILPRHISAGNQAKQHYCCN